MVCLVKNRTKFVKQTCLDLWGRHMSYIKLSKAVNFMRVISDQSRKRFRYYKKDFVFTLKKRINFRRQKRFKSGFLLPRLLYNFYLVLSRRTFMKYSNRAKKRPGYYIENYLVFVEGRLFMMVYRCALITNLFMIRYVIEHGIFWINDRLKWHYNSVVKPGDFLWFGHDKDWREFFRHDLLLRLYNNVILWPVPRYVVFNTKFMFILFWRYPRLSEIVYPAGKIDIYLANDYHII